MGGSALASHYVWNKYRVEDQREKWRHRPEVEARFEEILAAERQREQVWRDIADSWGWTKAGDDEGGVPGPDRRHLSTRPRNRASDRRGAAIKARLIAFEAWHLLSMMRLGGRDVLMRPWEGQS